MEREDLVIGMAWSHPGRGAYLDLIRNFPQCPAQLCNGAFCVAIELLNLDL